MCALPRAAGFTIPQRGLCLYLAGQEELYMLIEPRGNENWHRAGFEQNDTTKTPKDASYFILLIFYPL